MKKAMVPVAVLLAVLAQIGGSAASLDVLTYSRGFLLTGNYVVSTIDLPRGGGTGDLVFSEANGNAVPADAEIAAAYLYWEALAPAGSPIGRASFRGVDIATAKASRLTELPPTGSANCWGTSGNQTRVLTMFRADVLSMLPKQYDTKGKWTGRYVINNVAHSVELGTKASGNNLTTVAGATLLLVYRDPAEPLRKIVVYDGAHAQAQGQTTTQAIAGFYRSSLLDKSARLTHIVGSGANNAGERVLFNGSPLPVVNPIPAPIDSGSDRGWASPTFDVTSHMPGAVSSEGFGEVVTTGIDHGADNSSSTPYECLTWAAMVFSTTVEDDDRDGLPDALEEGTPLKDPATPQFPLGQTLPDLNAMGARLGQKDLFIEVNAMVADAGTTYGSPQAPYSSSLVSVTDPHGHNHMPTPAVIKRVGDAYLAGGIHAHFDVGDHTTYASLGEEYACFSEAGSECHAMPYLVPTALARGGELIVERASPNGQFKAFPGTVGWPLGVQVYRDAPVGDEGEELSNAEIREGWLDGTRRRRFDRTRQDYFHYTLYGHARGRAKSEFPCLDENGDPAASQGGACANGANPEFHVPSSASGIADLPGGTALITLGLWDTEKFVGSPFLQASTTLHELGHNANLWHGGKVASFVSTPQGTETLVEPNCKPNYLSVMSYMFQVHGLFDEQDRPHIDYSDRKHDPLNESALVEGPLSPFPKYRVTWFAPVDSELATFQGSPAAKRFCNGAPFGPAAPDPLYGRVRALTTDTAINWDGNPGQSGPVDIDFNGTTDQVFEGFNDWENLRLDQIRAARFARIFSSAAGDLIDFGSGDLIDFGSGDLIDFGSGDLIDFGSGTHIVHLGSGDFFKYGTGDLIDFGSGVFLAAGADAGYAGGDLIDFGSGDLIDFGSGDLIDFGSGDLIDFGSGDLIDFGSGDLIDFGSGDKLEFGGPGLQELTFEDAFEFAAPRPYGLAACIIGVDCVDTEPSDPNNRVRLTWNAPTFGQVTIYNVYRSTANTDAVVVGSTTSLSFIDTEQLPGGVLFTYWVNAQFDNGQSSNSDPVVIQTINPAPVAANDAYSTTAGTSLTVPAPGVLANDTNPDGPATSLVVADPGTRATSSGTVTINADGSFTYTPNAGFAGVDTFTYTAGKGVWSGDGVTPLSDPSNVATVTITVQAVDPPVCTAATAEVITGASVSLNAACTDPNGGSLTITEVSTPLLGTVTLKGGTAFVYAATSPNVGAEKLTLKVSDGTLSTTTTLTIRVIYGFINVQNAPPSSKTKFNSGSTIPVQWQWTNAAGTPLNSSAAGTRVDAFACSTSGKLPGAYPTGGFTPEQPGSGNSFAFKSASNTWQFNWKLTYTVNGVVYNLPAGTYVLQIKSDVTGQTDPRSVHACDGGTSVRGALVQVK
jgi:hypothetical protein